MRFLDTVTSVQGCTVAYGRCLMMYSVKREFSGAVQARVMLLSFTDLMSRSLGGLGNTAWNLV